MSQLDRQGLISQSNYLFPDNTTAEITPSDVRQFNQDLIDSLALTGSNVVSASYALTASYAENVTPIDTSSFATTGSNDFVGDQTITSTGSAALTITSGPGDTSPVIIEGGPDFINKFTASSIRGISTYGGDKISGSWGAVGSSPGGLGSGGVVGIYNNATSSNAGVVIRHASNNQETGYAAYTSISAQGGGVPSRLYLRGTEITLLSSTASLQTSVTVDGDVTASNFTGSFVGDGSGLTGVTAQYADNTIVYGKNVHTLEIPKGTPLYFTGSGTEGNLVGILPADAGNPLLMPAGGVAGETIAVGAEGVVLLDGFINGVDTSLFQSGQTVYVGVGGGYTNQKPTGSANLIQALGYVEKAAVNGSGVIKGSGRANDVPNIQEGYAWVGNGDGVATAVSTGSWDGGVTSIIAGTGISVNQSTGDVTITNTGGGGTIDTGSFATTGSNSFLGDQEITGSVIIDTVFGENLTLQKTAGGTPRFAISGSDGYRGEMTNKEFKFLASGSFGTDASLRIVEEGILTKDIAQANGNTNVILSSAPYNIFALQYNDYNGPVRGLFHNMSASLFAAPTDVIIGVDANDGSGWNGEMQIGNQYINKIRISGSLVGIEGAQTINTTDSNTMPLVVSNTLGNAIIAYSEAMQNASTLGLELPKKTAFGNGIIVNPSHPSSQSLFVTDGAAPRLEVLSQTDAASNGYNVSVDGTQRITDSLLVGNTLYTDIIQPNSTQNINQINTVISTNSPDSQSLSVDDGAQPRIIVQSQTAASATGVNIILNGATNLSDVTIGASGPSSQAFWVADGASPRLEVLSQNDAASNGYNVKVTGNEYVTSDIIVDGNVNMISGGGTIQNPNGHTVSNTFEVVTSIFTDSIQPRTTSTVAVTGSAFISDVLELGAQDPLPAGAVGQLAVSGSNLYFYNGAWTLVV